MGHIPVAKPSPIPRWTFPRRGFAIAFVLTGLIALIVVGIVTATPTGISRDSFTGPHWVKGVSVDHLQADQPVHVFEAKAWLVKTRSGEVLALSHKEPGRGCTIPWRPDFTFDGHEGWFRDPCSGSTFDMRGVKVFGSSPRGMDLYETRVVNGVIEVRAGDRALIQREAPEHDYETYYAEQ